MIVKVGRAAAAAGVAVGAAALLAACSQDTPLVDPTWQIVNVYRDPGVPSQVPDSSAGDAVMVFGHSSVAGNTGCGSFQAKVTYQAGGEVVAPGDADAIVFTALNIQPPGQCEGAALYVHEQLAEMLHGQFDISHDPDHGGELLLHKHTDAVDKPAIRLVANNS